MDAVDLPEDFYTREEFVDRLVASIKEDESRNSVMKRLTELVTQIPSISAKRSSPSPSATRRLRGSKSGLQ